MSIDAISRMLAPLRNRIANLVGRAVISLVDDSKKLQILQLALLEDETRGDVERFQNYGFTSHPQNGAEAVVLFVGGGRDHGLAIAVDDRRYRIRNLESGEVAVYTDQGDSIVIRRGGNIEITGASKVKLITPAVELAGNSEACVLGTTYRTAEDTLINAIGTWAAAVQPIGDPSGSATTTLAGAITTFQAAASTYLSTKVKLG